MKNDVREMKDEHKWDLSPLDDAAVMALLDSGFDKADACLRWLGHYETSNKSKIAVSELYRRLKVMRELCEAALDKREAQESYIDESIGEQEFYRRTHAYDVKLDAYRAMKGEKDANLLSLSRT